MSSRYASSASQQLLPFIGQFDRTSIAGWIARCFRYPSPTYRRAGYWTPDKSHGLDDFIPPLLYPAITVVEGRLCKWWS